MKILAIESSGLVASCAVIEDDVLLGEYTTDFKKTHSETLLPMIDSLCKLISLDKSTIDFVAVSSGPGSFTGLRIGGTTAKGIAMALGIPVVSVPTLMGLAYNLWGSTADIVPLMDARRGEVYTGIYGFSSDSFDLKTSNKLTGDEHALNHHEENPVSNDDNMRQQEHLITKKPQCAVPIEDIISEINSNGRTVIFLGDGVSVFSEKISALCQVPYSLVPASLNRQLASSVGALAMAFLRKKGITGRLSEEELEALKLPDQDGEKPTDDDVSEVFVADTTENTYKAISSLDTVSLFTADDFRPQYLRMSQAERERKARESQNG